MCLYDLISRNNFVLMLIDHQKGVRAILSQKERKLEKVVAYANKSLTEA
jgi:hypothetical protein